MKHRKNMTLNGPNDDIFFFNLVLKRHWRSMKIFYWNCVATLSKKDNTDHWK